MYICAHTYASHGVHERVADSEHKRKKEITCGIKVSYNKTIVFIWIILVLTEKGFLDIIRPLNINTL